MVFNWISMLNLGIVLVVFIPIIIGKIIKKGVTFKSSSAVINYFNFVGAFGSVLFMFVPFMEQNGEFAFSNSTGIAVWAMVNGFLIFLYWYFWVRFWVKGTESKVIRMAVNVIPPFIALDTGIHLSHGLLLVFSLIYLGCTLWGLSKDIKRE